MPPEDKPQKGDKAAKPAEAKASKPKDKEKGKDKEKKGEAAAPAAEGKPAKAAPAPRPPADPRLKYLKKFRGKFLPRGPLRDRHKVLMDRWNSGEDHGGVTADELKSLYEDWKSSREKKCKPQKA